MDKRLYDKSSNFFKKEGFYVVLFVCLCIVATVAAVTARNNRAAKNQPPVVEQPSDKNTDLASNVGDETKKDIENALEVKQQTPSAGITVPKQGAASVSKTVDMKFTKPIEGQIVRGYITTPDVYCANTGSWVQNWGIDIKADLGKSVLAALDGKVVAVDNDNNTKKGQYVIVDHQNGLKTVYANLDAKVSVKVGDTVKKGQVIGKIGNTRESYADEKIGDYLHFEVLKKDEPIDPTTYVKGYTYVKDYSYAKNQ